MNLETARLNYELLSSFEEGNKFTLDKYDMILSLDNRWLSPFQRSLWGESRMDILKPIEKTFEIIRIEKTSDEIINCLNHIETNFKKIYPNFKDIYDLLDLIISRQILYDKNKIYLAELYKRLNYFSRFENDFIIDISEIKTKEASDFISITLKSDKQWKQIIKEYPRNYWDYSYFSADKNEPNAEVAYLGKNTTFLDLTKEIGNVKYIDCSRFFSTITNGDYEVRICGKPEYIIFKFKYQNGNIFYL